MEFVLSVMSKILLAFAVFAIAYAQDPVPPRRNPNVCADVAAGTLDQFRNDWASCESYFWCNGPQAVPTGPCDAGFSFDESLQVCKVATCDECPAAPANIAVSLSVVLILPA